MKIKTAKIKTCLRSSLTSKNKLIGVIFVGLMLLTMEAVVEAQTPAALSSPLAVTSTATVGADDSGWKFRIAPYIWATSLKGSVGIRRISTDIDVPFHDLVDSLDGGLMLAVEARNDRWSINSDLIYAALSSSSGTPRNTVFTNAKVDIDEIIWTPTIGYTVYNSEVIALDLLGGFRLTSIGQDLHLRGGSLPSGAPVESRKLSISETWVDPIIGARSRIRLDDELFLQLMGDIGGFGANSKLTWQALSGLGYQLSNSTALAAGYRALGYAHDRNDFKFDLTMFGPFLGAEFKF